MGEGLLQLHWGKSKALDLINIMRKSNMILEKAKDTEILSSRAVTCLFEER